MILMAFSTNLTTMVDVEAIDAVDQRPLTPRLSMSACLLIKDDNDILDEWIAYHYFAVDMRYLLVAMDPHCSTDPRSILNKWQNLTDLQVKVWGEHDYMPAEYFIGTVDMSNYVSQAEIEGRPAEEVRLIQAHRYRQHSFLPSCYRHMKAARRTLVMHIDTDEYIVMNPQLRRSGSIRSVRLSSSPRHQSSIASVLRGIYQDDYMYKRANLPCISMPRILFGSVEDDKKVAEVPDGWDAATFETLRWHYHTAPDDHDRNRFPKAIVDVSRIPPGDNVFVPPVRSIHRPSDQWCRPASKVKSIYFQRHPLMVNHYLGSRERYFGRNDTRRSASTYEFKAAVNEGPDHWLDPWLQGFVEHAGEERARVLLGEDHLAQAA